VGAEGGSKIAWAGISGPSGARKPGSGAGSYIRSNHRAQEDQSPNELGRPPKKILKIHIRFGEEKKRKGAIPNVQRNIGVKKLFDAQRSKNSQCKGKKKRKNQKGKKTHGDFCHTRTQQCAFKYAKHWNRTQKKARKRLTLRMADQIRFGGVDAIEGNKKGGGERNFVPAGRGRTDGKPGTRRARRQTPRGK